MPEPGPKPLEPKKVLVLGAGFGGLTFCQAFRHPNASVTLVDSRNHHLFQPLLYQVASAGLSAPEIAEPARSILSHHKEVTVLMDTVTGFDLAAQRVVCQAYSYFTYKRGARIIIGEAADQQSPAAGTNPARPSGETHEPQPKPPACDGRPPA